MLITITILVVWLILGHIAYGIELNEFTTRWPYFNHANDLQFARFCGPIGIVVAILHNHTPLGLRFTPLTYEERWAAFNKEFPTLSREYFDQTFRDLGA